MVRVRKRRVKSRWRVIGGRKSRKGSGGGWTSVLGGVKKTGRSEYAVEAVEMVLTSSGMTMETPPSPSEDVVIEEVDDILGIRGWGWSERFGNF